MNYAAERRSCKAAFDMFSPQKPCHLYDFCLGLSKSQSFELAVVDVQYLLARNQDSLFCCFFLRPVGEVSFIKIIVQEAGPKCLLMYDR